MTDTERKEAAAEFSQALATSISPPMAKLGVYRVRQEMARLLQDAEDAETPEEIEAYRIALRQYVTAELTAVDDAAHSIKYLQRLVGTSTQRGLIDERINELLSYKERCRNALEYLKEICTAIIRMGGERRIQGATTAMRLQTNGGKPAVVIDDATLVPDRYVETTVKIRQSDFKNLLGLMREGGMSDLAAVLEEKAGEREIRNSWICEAIERGIEVPGAHLERGESLRVV